MNQPAPPVCILLVDRSGSVSDEHWSAWEHCGTAYSGDATLRLMSPAELLKTASDLGIGGDALVIVSDATTTPGPHLVDRLVGSYLSSQPGVVDARVLPVEVTRTGAGRYGCRVDEEATREAGYLVETRDPQPVEEAGDDSLTPQPRVSGACTLVPASTLPAVVEAFSVSPVEGSGGRLLSMAEEAGVPVTVEVTAAVMLPLRLDWDSRPVTSPPPERTPAPPLAHDLHPAALASTSLGTLLRGVGVEWPATEPTEGDRPFLSIVTRTQGTRMHLLEDVLTCLQAQTDRDFELVLACHRVPGELTRRVQDVVAALPAWLRERVRLIPVSRPGRAAPLNDGFSEARGRYVAVLDDDDTVLAHYVETFKALEARAQGRLLRVATVRQDITPYGDVGDLCAVSVGDPFRDWPLDFHFVDHLTANYSPFMSLAFPRGVFHDLGYRFDETLNTTEDWDFLVRNAAIVGVESGREVTSVYRWWVDTASSRHAHTDDEWDEARLRVQSRFETEVLLVPPGGLARVRILLDEAKADIVRYATSQHETNLEMTRTAEAHDAAVSNWQAAEGRAMAAREKVEALRERLEKRARKFDDRIDLLRRVDARIREGGLQRPEKSIFEMTAAELKQLLAAPTEGRKSQFLRSLTNRRSR